MQAKNNEREQEVLLEMKGLKVSFPIHKKWFPAVDGVDFSVYPGEITGIVGESGSIGISPLPTPHRHPFQRMCVRSSIAFYGNFNLDMDRSPGFGSTPTDLRPS